MWIEAEGVPVAGDSGRGEVGGKKEGRYLLARGIERIELVVELADGDVGWSEDHLGISRRSGGQYAHARSACGESVGVQAVGCGIRQLFWFAGALDRHGSLRERSEKLKLPS